MVMINNCDICLNPLSENVRESHGTSASLEAQLIGITLRVHEFPALEGALWVLRNVNDRFVRH